MLGVDRLDYTKGIPERLLAFGRLLEMFPEWRGKVSLVQVSVPSRADVPLYAEQRATIESIVGRINGEFGEAAWVPIRYLYRSYGKQQLAQLYRAARGRLRHAAARRHEPRREGVRRRAGPGEPGRAPALAVRRRRGRDARRRARRTRTTSTAWRAISTARCGWSSSERKARHTKLLASVQRSNAVTWAEGFLDALNACR